MLFLSEKVTLRPSPLRVQPSGYDMLYPATGSVKVRNTWLSGMSPVAADCASADRAATPCELPAVDVDELAGAVVLEVGVPGWVAVPQPTPARASRPQTASVIGARISPAMVANPSETLLNAGWRPARAAAY